MTMRGFDVASPVQEYAERIKADGYGFVGRYYSYNGRKNLTASEANKLAAAGLSMVTVFEAAGDSYSSFDVHHGANDAAQALKLAAACGQPEGSAIYFAVDFDPVPVQITGGIADYFRAVKAGIGGKYRIGVYGSGAVCKSLGDWGLAELYWLGGATGWSGTKTFAGAHIVQQKPAKVLGLNVDPNLAVNGDFGQWMPGVPHVDTGGATPPRRDAPAVVAIPAARDMQAALGVAADGLWGPLSAKALSDYYALLK